MAWFLTFFFWLCYTTTNIQLQQLPRLILLITHAIKVVILKRIAIINANITRKAQVNAMEQRITLKLKVFITYYETNIRSCVNCTWLSAFTRNPLTVDAENSISSMIFSDLSRLLNQ